MNSRTGTLCTRSSAGTKLTSMAIDYVEWRRGDAKRRAASAALVRDLENTRRTRPRAKVEAEFLRSIGTPERLIGPVRED